MMTDFIATVTDSLADLLFNPNLDAEAFRAALVEKVRRGPVTANQYNLLQEVATNTILSQYAPAPDHP